MRKSFSGRDEAPGLLDMDFHAKREGIEGILKVSGRLFLTFGMSCYYDDRDEWQIVAHELSDFGDEWKTVNLKCFCGKSSWEGHSLREADAKLKEAYAEMKSMRRM